METVIIVNDFAFVNGGAEKVAIQSAIELSKTGKNVFFFSAVGPICEELENSNVKVICLNNKDILRDKNRIRAIITGLWNLKAQKIFEKSFGDIDRRKCIVHIHSWQKALTSSVILKAYKMGFRITLTLHNYSIACPNGGFYDFNKQKVCKLKPLSFECICRNCDSRSYTHKIWRIIRQILETNIVNIKEKVFGYIYISEKSKKILEKNIGEDAKYYYVSNPTNLTKEDRIKVENNKIYAFVGRLSKEKGCITFAKAIGISDVKSIFIGDGEMRNDIIETNKNIKITGWIEEAEINKILKDVRAIVLPSLWYEGMPLVALEGLSKGIPVIVSDVCNATELVMENVNGLYFKVNEERDLAKQLNKLKDNEYIKELSINAHHMFWEKPFNIKRHIKELDNAYEEMFKEGM